ncbi:hypothetical protein [uncultured Endozoicomonas sp.]|uniref:hypothetical protein n=1 Tax=uncultured Endozoicomonas sp. TaxID=432652 RepID=UPI0026345415|nr:hypothetical protein [uncultured Endozoicomonas sp.]
MSQLLNEFDIPHDGCLSSMIEASQQWRRKPAQERWELPDINLSAEKTHRVFQLLKQLRMTGSIEPPSNQYDYLLLLGSTAPGMLHRLQHLTELWDKGLRFKHLIFLVSERPLHATMDQSDVLAKWAQAYELKPAKTETDAAILLHKLADLPIALKAVPTEFIDTPGHVRQGYWYRPNTRDTLKHWLKQKPVPGSTLVITDQPHGNYQETVVRQELPETFTVDLSTGSAKPSTRMVIYLDSLALWLHNLGLHNLSQQNQMSDLCETNAKKQHPTGASTSAQSQADP